MWLLGACQFLFLGQDGSRWHNPSAGVQALLISVCHGERTPETVGWPKAQLEPRTMLLGTVSFTWRNYVRKSRIARLMWLLGASQFLFLGQNGSRWHNPSPGVQALLISVCHGERTPETVGWPKAHLDTTSNHAPWNSEPKSCAWRVPKTQTTTNSMADLNCQKLHLEKLRSEIKNSPVDVAPRC